MKSDRITIDTIAHKFSQAVVAHLHAWMNANDAEDIDFHRYRMKLLTSLGDDNSATEKLLSLINRVPFPERFELVQIISDKIMGDKIAKFIFANVIIDINAEFKKILDMESDKINAEIKMLIEKTGNIKIKLAHH